MPIAFVDNKLLVLPTICHVGKPLTAIDAEMLNEIKINRTMTKLRYLIKRGELNQEEVQAKVNELMQQPLEPYGPLTDDDNDPITLEAISIATELITTFMAKENLPPPKNITDHAKALIQAMPKIYEQARLRLEAQYRAAAETIANLSNLETITK
jgi:polyhydroxyalkanoate synthesis regulator phasin